MVPGVRALIRGDSATGLLFTDRATLVRRGGGILWVPLGGGKTIIALAFMSKTLADAPRWPVVDRHWPSAAQYAPDTWCACCDLEKLTAPYGSEEVVAPIVPVPTKPHKESVAGAGACAGAGAGAGAGPAAAGGRLGAGVTRDAPSASAAVLVRPMTPCLLAT